MGSKTSKYNPINNDYDDDFEVIDLHHNEKIENVYEFYLNVINQLFKNIKELQTNKNEKKYIEENIKIYIDEIILHVQQFDDYLNCINFNYKDIKQRQLYKNKINKYKSGINKMILSHKP